MLIIIETDCLKASFDCETGSLVGLYSKTDKWEIIQRWHLGFGWRIMIPLEGKRNNEAVNTGQKTNPECFHSDHHIEFVWETIRSEYGGGHPVRVCTRCENANGQLLFTMSIENQSDLVIENIYYPCIGDLHRANDVNRMVFLHGIYSGIREFELYPHFHNPIGTHSVDYPTMTVPTSHGNPPMYPFGLVSDDQGRGLYIGAAKREIAATTWHAETLPGWRSSNEFKLFDEDVFEGKDVYTRFSVGHLPFIAPGSRFELLPFSMEAFHGDWTRGIDCYTKLSRSWNKRSPEGMPPWVNDPHSWLQIQINSPEDELRISFKDLPQVGEDCLRHGVGVIQLVGWNDGGQDRGNPSHSPDPRLGTFEELKTAIHRIQEMGVKVVLFAKFVWADQSREDFEEKYQAHAIKNPYGDYEVYKGYQYMTLSQLADVNTRRLIPMCFGSEEYRKICNEEFMKCVELGADGILFDECLHHSPTLCCFDKAHGHRRGESTYQYDEELIRGFRDLVKDREFLIAGEAVYDFQHDYYDLSYTRTWGCEHKPVSRYMRPERKIMSAVIGFNDRNMINQCLLNNYVISYEPYHFKGMLSDFPSTVAYGNKMDRLRKDLRAYFWDGEYLGKGLGTVTGRNGQTHGHFSVYRSVEGCCGMILCNYDSTKSLSVKPTIKGTTLTRYRLVDHDTEERLDEWVDIPPESAIAVY